MESRHERIARIALAWLLFADALGALTQITDAAFAEYRTDPSLIADMRHRFAQWRHDLLAADPN
jgi:hypothetical protein